MEQNTTSCQPRQPFIELGTGAAPGLNYNLPQKTAFSVYGRIPTPVKQSWFVEGAFRVPDHNWWDVTSKIPAAELETQISGVLTGSVVNNGIIRNYDVLRKPKVPPVRVASTKKGVALQSQPLDRTEVDALVSGISQGLMPVATPTFGGATIITWIPKPQPKPAIYIVEEYSMASYLGEYGAGKTVSTFSLLPGEVTSISVKTYEDSSETDAVTQNVLDSFTQESADEFESTLQNESGQTDTDTTGTSTDSNMNVALMVDLFGIVKVGGESTGEVTDSVSSTRESYTTMTSSALEKHVTNTSSRREVQVNTTSTTTVSSGTENTITRTIENINKSRVLNFVFRQLQQEYITVTYLKSVRFLYSNGFGETVELVEIPKLETLLAEKLKPEFVKEAMALLLRNYCVVYNHKGQAIPFLEKVVQRLEGCPFARQGEEVSFWRKRADLADAVDSITVSGPILRVDRSILRTPAVIVDGLLGGGECLDCYNDQMQRAAVASSDLENKKVAAALEILNQIADPAARADAYQKMFYPPVEPAAPQADAS